ncbi:TolC family protein [Parabacteroides sp.]
MMNAQITIKRSLSLFLLVFLVSPGSLRAQSGWTVDDCMRYAVEQNYRIRNSRLNTRIAEEDLTAAYGDFLPSVSVNGALGKRVAGTVDLNVSLPVFDGFTRVNRLQFRKLNRLISGLAEKTEENRVAFEVMEAFFRLCFDEKMHQLAVEQRKLSERYHEQMLEYVDLGMRSPSDLQEVKARLQSDVYQETVKANGCRLSLLALKELLNMRDTDTLAIFPDEESELPVLPALESNEICAASETSLPEFRAMELRERASRKSLALASGAFFPSVKAEFSLYSGYYDTGRDEQGGVVPIKEQLKNNMNKYIGVSVSLPLFSGLSRLTGVRKERFRLRRIQNENEQRRLGLYKEIDDACLSLRAAIEEHRLALEQLRASSIMLKESEEKWEEGMISVFELMEKRNLYIMAKAELSRVRLQYALKRRLVEFYRTGSFVALGMIRK